MNSGSSRERFASRQRAAALLIVVFQAVWIRVGHTQPTADAAERALHIEANVTYGFGPTAGGIIREVDWAYRVQGQFRNDLTQVLVFDTIDGSFTSARGGRFAIKRKMLEGDRRWRLAPGEIVEFAFDTDGRTNDLLEGAENYEIFYVLTLYLADAIVAGPYIAKLPPGNKLPDKGGPPLAFERTQIEGW